MTEKRSLSIRGHRTSISIEEPFWAELKRLAARRGRSLADLVAAIDGERDPDTNLSSAIRLHVLAATQARAETPFERGDPAHVMLSHVYIGVRDFDRALRFWAAVAREMNLRFRFEEPERGWAGWQPAEADRPLFLIGRPFDGEPASVGNGAMVAFQLGSREAVDKTHALALALGGQDEGAPGPRPHYHPHYYGAYFRDPDGNKIGLACHRPEPEMR
ncbi:ribbon-helix-helix domain-containing protein [Aureimonas ureilytica]|uniref:ribbon-helix-helix domain-containing protein n=1 Tax=Aureimonas ureilytica TaxID=401562 RepID=UPI00035DD1A9|nr:ribbon-helix-helix domain-containing protein [Aureimonas ureilytica]